MDHVAQKDVPETLWLLRYALVEQLVYLDNVVVLYSCQYCNLLAYSTQHGVIYPAVTHYPGLANELHYHLQRLLYSTRHFRETPTQSTSQTNPTKGFLTSCASLRLTAFHTKPKAPLPTAVIGWYSSSNCPSQACECSRSMVERNASPWLASPILYRMKERVSCRQNNHFGFKELSPTTTDLS